MKTLLTLGAFFGNIPFALPFLDLLYYGIVLANWQKFPALVPVLTVWGFIYGKAAPESNEILLRQGDTTAAWFGRCCLSYMRWPLFLAALYALNS